MASIGISSMGMSSVGCRDVHCRDGHCRDDNVGIASREPVQPRLRPFFVIIISLCVRNSPRANMTSSDEMAMEES